MQSLALSTPPGLKKRRIQANNLLKIQEINSLRWNEKKLKK